VNSGSDTLDGANAMPCHGHRRGHCDGNQGASIPGPKLRRLLLARHPPGLDRPRPRA